MRSYRTYSIGCFVVWALLLIVVSTTQTSETRRTFLLVFGGWCIGWLSASIARQVYPPPRRRVVGD